MRLFRGMKSRRGRELASSQKIQKRFAGPENVERYKTRSALCELDEFIAAFTHDRVPPHLVEARNAIYAAETIEELEYYIRSPYKVVRDAARDEARLKQGLAPIPDPGSYTFRWGQLTDTTLKSQQMGPEETFDSPVERFNVEDHKLARRPGKLAGSVHKDYTGYRHHLQARFRDEGLVDKASIETADYNPMLPVIRNPNDSQENT